MKLPSKNLERNLFESGYDYVCGVDEVGVGCLAGPVVVCAALAGSEFYKTEYSQLKGLRESKLLSAKQREKFAAELLKIPEVKFKIFLAEPETIDKLNIYQAARETMRRATKAIVNLNKKTMVLVDGPREIDNLAFEQQAIVKGDQNVFVIACASIIAKVHRDKLMRQYALEYPGYGFEKHKGYGTRQHQTQLTVLGPCAIHRRSFAPVAQSVKMVQG